MAAKFYKFRDQRPQGRAHDVRLDRIIAVSDIAATSGFWQFYATVDCGVEVSFYWCASTDRDTINKWHSDLMGELNGDA